MGLIEGMRLDDLQNNVIRRNLTISALKESLRELKKYKKELDGMAGDSCHIGTDLFIRREYERIIKDIESLIKLMNTGDWCFSIESTKKREKDM